MTTRDRLAMIGVAVLVLLAAVWIMLVAPERDRASKLATQVSQAGAQLAATEGEANSARSAQARYAAAYAAVVSLGKAVPPSEEVPALIYQLAQASNQKHVEFSSITNGAGTSAGTAASAPVSAPAAASAGFTQMPFTFVFNGSFADLYHLFRQLDAATARTPTGVQVSGRLLTLQGVKLEPQAGTAGGGQLTGTITATAYVLPAAAGLTAGATPSAPGNGATSTSSGGSSGSSIVRRASSASATPAAVVTAGGVR